MDGHRFDRFAKSLASWTSRRRFVAGLAGGAAGGLVGARGIRAQEGTPQSDTEVLTQIQSMAEEILPRINPELYTRNKQQFDPERIPELVRRLQALMTSATQATTWNDAQLQSFLDTIVLVPLSVSAGSDADVFLYQYAVSELGGNADPQATPSVPDNCISPHRPGTCTATCLQVWLGRQKAAEAAGDVVAIVDAFLKFLACFLLWGSDSTECLAPLIEDGCIPQIDCGCTGDCS